MPSFGGSQAIEPAPAEAEVVPPAGLQIGTEIDFTMDCAALSASPGFVREIKLTGGDGIYSMTNGEAGKHRYEHWEMQIDAAGAFVVSGEYIEGTTEIKQLSFEGAANNGRLEGKGKRGPRPCTLRAAN